VKVGGGTSLRLGVVNVVSAAPVSVSSVRDGRLAGAGETSDCLVIDAGLTCGGPTGLIGLGRDDSDTSSLSLTSTLCAFTMSSQRRRSSSLKKFPVRSRRARAHSSWRPAERSRKFVTESETSGASEQLCRHKVRNLYGERVEKSSVAFSALTVIQ
jgi:hypothetical protein